VLGKALVDAFQSGPVLPRHRVGCLLSFIPTLSEGMSPALQNVTERISLAFSHTEQMRQLSLWG
jgi:hypothetical protein